MPYPERKQLNTTFKDFNFRNLNEPDTTKCSSSGSNPSKVWSEAELFETLLYMVQKTKHGATDKDIDITWIC